MGMFDTGIVTCPHCGEITEEQTKSFNCNLEYFNLDELIDPFLAVHFAGEWECNNCGRNFYIKSPLSPNKILVEVTKDR